MDFVTGTRHVAGRTGMGAVMGTKNLKAIAVRGQKHHRKQEERVRELVRDYVDKIRTAPRYETYARFSNSAFVTWANEVGILATRNYRQVRFEGADRIDGQRLIHYNLAGSLGIDVISTASALAFAMDLYERGILSMEDTGGIELTWGNAEAMETMMHRIAQREGFGAMLAEGVRRAAEIIGRGAGTYAYHSKGLELTAYDPRGGMGTALGYAVSTRGGDFTSVYTVPEYRWEPEQGREWFGTEKAVNRLSIEGKGELVKRTMVVSAVLDALGICKVPVLSVVGDYSLENEAALTAALTGWDVTAEELALAGERIINLEKVFNVRHGASREDDDLPDHFTEDRVPDPGPTQGMTVDIQHMVKDFYDAMGWDENGYPTSEKLKELGLERQ